MTKLRLKFSKHGPIKYLGHLDVMRYFQKAIRRAGIDIKYSEGYHPHQLLNFAQPLGVGITSDGEYLDLTVNTLPADGADGIVRALNSVMNEGIIVTGHMLIEDNKDKAMTQVAGAAYTVRFRKGYAPTAGWEEQLADFCSTPQILVMKRTKKGEKETDIKPSVHEVLILKNAPEEDDATDSQICLILSAGNTGNVRPELLIGAFLQSINMELKPASLIVHRVDTYQSGEDEEGIYFEPLIPDGNKFYRNDTLILLAD